MTPGCPDPARTPASLALPGARSGAGCTDGAVWVRPPLPEPVYGAGGPQSPAAPQGPGSKGDVSLGASLTWWKLFAGWLQPWGWELPQRGAGGRQACVGRGQCVWVKGGKGVRATALLGLVGGLAHEAPAQPTPGSLAVLSSPPSSPLPFLPIPSFIPSWDGCRAWATGRGVYSWDWGSGGNEVPLFPLRSLGLCRWGRSPVRLGDRAARWAPGSGEGAQEPRREAGAGEVTGRDRRQGPGGRNRRKGLCGRGSAGQVGEARRAGGRQPCALGQRVCSDGACGLSPRVPAGRSLHPSGLPAGPWRGGAGSLGPGCGVPGS